MQSKNNKPPPVPESGLIVFACYLLRLRLM